MKLKYLALSMACVMAVSLAGCSANRDSDGVNSVRPSSGVSDSGDRASEGIDGNAQVSHGFSDAESSAGVGDNAAQGGGAGGTDDASQSSRPSDGLIDDIGDAAGDLTRGAGNAIRDAGDAIGDAAGDVGRAMR